MRLCMLFAVMLLGLCAAVAAEEPPNAFDDYRRAGEALQNVSRIQQFYDSKATTPGLDVKRAVVAENARALALLRAGFAHPCRFPEIIKLTEPMPYLAQFRNLSRLLKLEAEVKAADRDWAGACDSCLDSVYLGADIQHGAPLIGSLVGIACQAIGRKSLWGYLPHLAPAQARRVATRLQAVEAHAVTFAGVLQAEQTQLTANLRNWREHPEEFKDIIEENTADTLNVSPEAFKVVSRQFIDDALVDYIAYMEKFIAMARTPYPAWKPLPAPTNQLVKILLVDFHKAGFHVIRNQAHLRLLLVQCALQACKGETGKYPPSLAALRPAYLADVPLDPFSAQQPLRYKLTKTSYLLYSIGPDGRDNGGVPVKGPGTPIQVVETSTGDIVAGITGY